MSQNLREDLNLIKSGNVFDLTLFSLLRGTFGEYPKSSQGTVT